MRLLADENFPRVAVTALEQQGHDIVWIRTDAPGSSDGEIMVRAQAEERIILTFDKDLGEARFSFWATCYKWNHSVSLTIVHT